MAESRVFISEQFFLFKGAGKKAGSSLYQCLNCPENLKKKMVPPCIIRHCVQRGSVCQKEAQ